VVGTVEDESRQGADGVGNVHDVGQSRLSQELVGWQYLARPPGNDLYGMLDSAVQDLDVQLDLKRVR